MAGGQHRPHQTVVWWDLTSLRPQAPLPGLTDRAEHVAVSPDGNWCAAAGHRQDLVMWDAKTRKEKFRAPPRVRRNNLGYFAVEFSSDNKYLIASSVDTLSVWSVETGEQVTNRKGQYGQILVIGARPGADEALIDTGRAAVLIAIPSLQTLRSFPTRGHFDSASFSADGRRLVYGGTHVPPRVWDLEADQEVYTYEGRADEVRITPDGEKLIVIEATSMIAVALP
jgi:WD40 repeat protein